MAKILIVHGISNQFRGENELREAWYPALCDGLNRAGATKLPDKDDCFCPFYGDEFRPAGHLGAEAAAEPLDAMNADLVEAVWRAAVDGDRQVPAPEDFDETLFRSPKFAERALVALARSKWLADMVPLKFFGDLGQVDRYLRDRATRARILERVTSKIGPDTKLVIGHSLGSVIAYEAVCAKPGRVGALLTLGSPLGIPNAVFHRLTPSPNEEGMGVWPGGVERWTNIAAAGDIVAAQKTLAPRFGNRVRDRPIDSGWDAHSSTRYLNNKDAGEAIRDALA